MATRKTTATATSTGSALVLNAAPAITTQPVATQTVLLGSPATFSLVVVETGVIYRVRRVWRRKSQVGVEFLASEVLLTSRTEDLYFDFMRRVQSLPPSEVR